MFKGLDKKTIKILMVITTTIVTVPLFYVTVKFFIDYTNLKNVELIEEIKLYDGESSVEFSLKNRSFLFGLLGDLEDKKMYVTKIDGSTEVADIDEQTILFEVGNEWSVRKEIIQQVQDDGSVIDEWVKSYTIIGTKEGLVNLTSEFTKTFRIEAVIAN